MDLLLVFSSRLSPQAPDSDGPKRDAKVRSAGSAFKSRANRREDKQNAPRYSKGPDSDRQKSADPEDLHELVVNHSDAVYRLAFSICRDASLAEDIAQDALVKAWLALPSFRGDSSLRGWILRITHNTAISTQKTRRALVVDPTEMPEKTSVADLSVERKVQSNEVMSAFVDALGDLDELSRSIIVLRELEGLSYDEISVLLEVPLPTVKTRLLRSRRRLGSVLKEWA